MHTLPILLLGLLTASAPAAEIDYRRDVKPIFQARCVACHGAVSQKARLRLDAAPLIRKGGRHGSPVVAGKPEASLLLDAVLGRDRPRMPPEADGEGLSEKEIARLRAWIEQGAKMPDEAIPDDPRQHWAFRPPVRAVIPAHPGGNAIDAFLAAERAKVGTTSNGPADRATLLRRVTLDLIGVPPTPAELHAFQADSRSDAFERVVERLLADPRHGERWGRHWMDVWRYSDPFGLGEEYRYSQRHIWRWRDWIIESLNADRGYDQMVREMLAGDEIAPTDRDTLRATGYLARNWYKFNRNVWLADTVEYTSAGFLGLTFRCARCHDHKYDPISQQDYYQLRAFFEPHDIRIDPVPGEKDLKKDGIARAFDAKPDAPTYLFRRGDERQPDTAHKLSPALPAFLGGPPLVIGPVAYSSADHLRALKPAVAEALRRAHADLAHAEDEIPRTLAALRDAEKRRDRFDLGEKVPEAEVPAWFHDTFAKKSDAWKIVSGQWAWENGKLVGKQPGTFSTVSLTRNHPANLMGRLRYRTIGGPIGSVGFSWDVAGTSFQAVYVNAGSGSAVRAFHRVNGADTYPGDGVVAHPVKLGQEVTLDFAVRGDRLNTWVDGQLRNVYKLPRPRQAGTFTLWTHQATVEFLELKLLELPASVVLVEKAGDNRPSPLAGRVILTKEDADRAVTQAEQAVRAAEGRLRLARLEIDTIQARAAAEEAKYTSPRDEVRFQAAARSAGKLEREAAILRADLARDAKALAAAKARDEAVYTPLARFDTGGSTGRRLALANWIVARTNPLTARVAVNHVWMHHFGTPLVPTPGNFGLAGGKPTHPELLDWLAVEFMESGWSLKHLHRLIVTSDAYRLSSTPSPSRQRDPDNRTLWRMNPRRMEAEAVRDSLLSLAGQLDRAMGGPILSEKLGATSHRRSVYFRFNTEYQMDFLEPFDPASPTECYRRHESVVPQQALALFNSALALNQSRRLAKQLADRESGPFVRAAYEAILSRLPTPTEAVRCETFLREQAVLYARPGTPFPPASGQVLPAATDPVQRAREDLLQVLLNHNDFVTIR